MNRNPFYPRRVPERPEWHTNFAAKLQQYGVNPLGLSTDAVNNGVADNLTLAYGLGVWITNVREFAPSCTAALRLLESGDGNDDFVFPVYAAPALPALPAGVDPVTTGALNRTFDLVQIIKRSAGYTDAIGIDMGVVGSEDTSVPGTNSSGGGNGSEPTPRIKVTVFQGVGQENARIKFFKDGHTGLWLESRRGGGAWEFLVTTDKSPYIDTRALLVAGQAEIREYRARFWDQGQPNGGWCDVAKVTVSP